MCYSELLYAIAEKKSPPHIQAHLLLRASAPKELSLPHRHPRITVNNHLIL